MREMAVNRDRLEELVSHVQTLVRSFDSVRRDGNALEWHYARDRIVDLISAYPFNGDRFQIRRMWWGSYRIWDTNHQAFWRSGAMGMGATFSTRERAWAQETVSRLNQLHREQHRVINRAMQPDGGSGNA